MVPLVLLLGGLSKPRSNFTHWPAWADIGVGILLGAVLLITHPFITITTALALGFLLLWQKDWRNPRFWVISLSTGGLLLAKFVLAERNAYEAERASRLLEAWEVLSHLPDYHISSVIWRYFDTQYALPAAIFGLCLISLVVQRRWGVALYTLLSSLVLLALIVLTHAYLSTDIYIMLDGYLAHLGLLWGLPLAYHWTSSKQPWALLLIAALLTFSLVRISDSRKFFQERLAYVQQTLDEQTSPEHPKGVAYLTDLNYEKLWIGWALGVETLLLSSLEGPQHSRNIYLADKPGDLEGRLDEPDLFLSVPFGPEQIKRSALPPRYFQLPAKPYREVTLPR